MWRRSPTAAFGSAGHVTLGRRPHARLLDSAARCIHAGAPARRLSPRRSDPAFRLRTWLRTSAATFRIKLLPPFVQRAALCLSAVAWLFTGRYLTDTVTALKLFSRADLASLPLETTGFELDHEITARMLARGRRIVEVPIRYYPRSREEGKKIGPRDWFIAVRTFWRYRTR